MTDLSPTRFDAATAARKREKLWGAPSIAQALGVSVDTVRRLARIPSVPIYKPAGYFAYRSELESWLRSKPED